MPDHATDRPTLAPSPIPAIYLVGFSVMILLGAVGMIFALVDDPQRAWFAYLINFLFFVGVGSGATVFSAAVNLAGGRWSRQIKRSAEGLSLFLPVSFILFLLMIPGLDHIMPWIFGEHYGPPWWTDKTLLIIRNGVGLFLLSAVGMAITALSARADLGKISATGSRFEGPIHRMLRGSFDGSDEKAHKIKRLILVLSPIYIALYAAVMTMLAVDFIMSLKQSWISTLIGGYFFIGCFYISLAFLIIGVVWNRHRFSLHEDIGPKNLHDLGKLTMAFGILTADFFYCQLMLIWYGNMPYENSFLIDRMQGGTPYRTLGIFVMLVALVLPIITMTHRKLKTMSAPTPSNVLGTVIVWAPDRVT